MHGPNDIGGDGRCGFICAVICQRAQRFAGRDPLEQQCLVIQ
jgi:hypothetical protein